MRPGKLLVVQDQIGKRLWNGPFLFDGNVDGNSG